MEKKTIIIAIVTFIVGILLSGAVASYAVNGNNSGMMNVYGMHERSTVSDSSASNMSMNEMASGLSNKTGDEFDKAFIAEMIVHHQGAIDMANIARTNAKHQEIKDLADAIVNAQTKEMSQMKNWQTDWGYSTSSSTMKGHEMMGM